MEHFIPETNSNISSSLIEHFQFYSIATASYGDHVVNNALSKKEIHVIALLMIYAHMKVGVCRIFFGSLPKSNIRQFGRIFCRSRIFGSLAEYTAEAE